MCCMGGPLRMSGAVDTPPPSPSSEGRAGWGARAGVAVSRTRLFDLEIGCGRRAGASTTAATPAPPDRSSSSPPGSSPRGSNRRSRGTPPLGSSTGVDTLTKSIDHRQYVRVKLVQVISEECCPEVLTAPLGSAEAEDVAAALRVVADPARLRLLSLISNAEGAEACVCNLTAPLGLTQPTVSHHLKVLTDAGLLEREQRGRWAYYRIVPERLELLRGALVTPVSAVNG
jgi:ArsR family transcriptional regulator, arsenate/arsenite/antimonite-responsive transcriptional repressor